MSIGIEIFELGFKFSIGIEFFSIARPSGFSESSVSLNDPNLFRQPQAGQPIKVNFSLKFSGFKKNMGTYIPLLQVMVCNIVQRFLPVVGDTRLHGLQEFRALWLLAQGCRKTTPSIENIM